MRSDVKHHGTWGLPGGKMEAGETIMDTIVRECQEELGSMPEYIQLVPLEKFTSLDKKFTYHTFFCSIANEFAPTLNDEHIGWAWVKSGNWPKPLHPGLWSTVNFSVVQTKIQQLQKTYTSA